MKSYIISRPIPIKDNQGNTLNVSPIALKLMTRDNKNYLSDINTAINSAKNATLERGLDPNKFACAIFEIDDSNPEPTSAYLKHIDPKKYCDPIDLTQYTNLTITEAYLINNALVYQEKAFINEKTLKKNQLHYLTIPLIISLTALFTVFLSYAVFNMGLAISAGIAAALMKLGLIISQLGKEEQCSTTDETQYHRQMLTILTKKKQREKSVKSNIQEDTVHQLNMVLDAAPPASFDNVGALTQVQPPRNALQVVYWQEKILAKIEILATTNLKPIESSYSKTKMAAQDITQIETAIAATANKLDTEDSKLRKRSKRSLIPA